MRGRRCAEILSRDEKTVQQSKTEKGNMEEKREERGGKKERQK